ncbi:hypothetical protein QQX98_012866 [Neonectria punicea]|uniref:NACHT-NTPase and P-loop NTPases N-terminal domain-containing protein n=1 Tax=Neonectria punicea TaxID=979145 RepID=A0ABR1GHQ4_9HYPO
MAAAVTNLISSTITTLDAATPHYNAVKDDRDLREAFHEAGRCLPLVRQVLQTANARLAERNLAGDPQSAQSAQSAMNSMKECNAKAMILENIFKAVAQDTSTSTFERYRSAARLGGQGWTVEDWMMRMMNDVCALAENDAIRAQMEDQVKGLCDAIERLSKMEPSVPRSGGTFTLTGPGDQFNAPDGTQNISTGSGNQFPGAAFSGSVQFG